MKIWVKTHWFQLAVIILLIMVNAKLQSVIEMTERVWDQGNSDAMRTQTTIMDSSSDIIRAIEDLQ